MSRAGRSPVGSASGFTVVGLAVAAVWVALALAASNAARARHDAALDGELLRAAHEIGAELREGGPEALAAVFDAALARSAGRLDGLALVDSEGVLVGTVGRADGAGAREVDLQLGRSWGPAGVAGRGHGPLGAGEGSGEAQGAGLGARRRLRLVPSATALARPWSERALLPAALLLAVALVAGARAVGQGLDRERTTRAAAAERERLAVLGRAGAGLAHQLRTPLATLKGRVQLLRESGARPDDSRLGQILAQAERMERLLDRLLDFARPAEAQREEVDLRALGAELAARGLPLDLRLDERGPVRVDREHLTQILENLIENALAASPPAGRVDLLSRALAGEGVELAVGDRGAGPGDDPERWFEPYATGRADGTGLGLPIARALARANGGDLSLAPRPGGGTLARLRLERGG